MAVAHIHIYDEFAEFITSSPTLEQIANFRLSEESEQYVSDLLEMNRTRGLSADEQVALDEYLRLEHLMRMAKIRAFAKLDNLQHP
jgi:hypothetical protein